MTLEFYCLPQTIPPILMLFLYCSGIHFNYYYFFYMLQFWLEKRVKQRHSFGSYWKWIESPLLW